MSDHVEILYEEGPCLAVLKPSGILTQAPPGIDSMEVRLKSFLSERDNKPGNIYLGVPHRLDRPVSGAMLFARHVRACRRLSEQFFGRLIGKVYWACVDGIVQPAAGTWQDWVRKIPGAARAEVVDQRHADAKRAVMHYRTIGRCSRGSWLEIKLETGRMHQIRLQTAERGHPILGDLQYGSKTPFGQQYEDSRRRAIALHGRSLTFRHPMTREAATVTAVLPQDWDTLHLTGDPPSKSDQTD
jgi:23S rRNA pseudouridine1911/1915/1917 synthase